MRLHKLYYWDPERAISEITLTTLKTKTTVLIPQKRYYSFVVQAKCFISLLQFLVLRPQTFTNGNSIKFESVKTVKYLILDHSSMVIWYSTEWATQNLPVVFQLARKTAPSKAL